MIQLVWIIRVKIIWFFSGFFWSALDSFFFFWYTTSQCNDVSSVTALWSGARYWIVNLFERARKLSWSPFTCNSLEMVNSPDSSSSSDSYASPVVSFNLIQHSQTQPSDETSSCSTNRLGTLLLKSRTNPKNDEIVQKVETPGLISSAPRGSLNHLTRDNFKRIKPCNSGVHISLEHL